MGDLSPWIAAASKPMSAVPACPISVQITLLARKPYGMVESLKLHSRSRLTVNRPLVKIGTTSPACDHNWNWEPLRAQIKVESPQGAKKCAISGVCCVLGLRHVDFCP